MRKKILFIVWSFSMGGGAEKILANILNNIDLEKYEVDVLEYINFDIKQEKIPVEINRIKPIINYNQSNRYIRYVLDKLCIYFPKIVRRIILNKKYDVEISFNERIPTFLLDDSAKCLCWIHGSMYGMEKSKNVYKKQYKVFKKVNKVIAISNNTYKSIKDLFPDVGDKIVKIYNGYDFDNIKKLSLEKCKVILNDKTLVFIGRLDENKQPLDAIKCLKKLHNKGCYYHLAVLGKGELLEEMTKLAYEYHLSEFICFYGYLNNPFPIVKQAKAIVSFSKSEGFPTIFVEGLALAVPFVSSNVGGVEELSNNGKCGKVFKNIDESVEILANIYKNNITFNKEDFIKVILQFSIQEQISNLEKLINNDN